jgi:hypothetical protein
LFYERVEKESTLRETQKEILLAFYGGSLKDLEGKDQYELQHLLEEQYLKRFSDFMELIFLNVY